MIRLEFDRGWICIIPDHDDAEKLRRHIVTAPFAFERSGVWVVNQFLVDELRILLRPFNDLLVLSDAFSQHVQQFKENNVESWTPSDVPKALLKETVLIDANINRSRFMTDNFPSEKMASAMSYFFKGAVNTSRYKEKKWDGYIHLLDAKTRQFPTGLLYTAKSVLEKAKIPYRIVYKYDRAPKRRYDWVVDDGLTPDPDQIEAVEKAIAEKRSVVKAPTGFGKFFAAQTTSPVKMVV